MNNNVKIVRLTERDKNILAKHGNICTDSHGAGCSPDNGNGHDKEFN